MLTAILVIPIVAALYLLMVVKPDDRQQIRFVAAGATGVCLLLSLLVFAEANSPANLAQAQAMLAPRFQEWVATTATTAGERANLPALQLNPGAAGLGSLRREYSKPVFVLLAMVGLILAITCANIANLLLARAAAQWLFASAWERDGSASSGSC